ncbi:MAG: pyridoxal phosphate-dependent aminotransferase [Planctomycetota bacterium]
MAISKKIDEYMSRGSWIRKMFEEGVRLRKQFGDENVFDLTLGNPVMEPPAEFKNKLFEEVKKSEPGMHRYMPNAGYEWVREAVADYYREETGLDFSAKNITMTTGAAGALNVVLKTILDPGDEVIIISPYFVEYSFYIDNHGGVTKVVNSNDDFSINISRIEEILSSKTKAVIINSPNNPTGVLYGEYSLRALGQVLLDVSKKYRKTIYLINDEPYRKIIYDGKKASWIFNLYDNSIVVTSHSKDLAIPGERIGHLAISPKASDVDKLSDGATFCNRTLGYVNAPALMQRVVAGLQKTVVDVGEYQKRRDYLYEKLSEMGYSVVKPQGAFYMFPRTPISDDTKFVKELQKKNVLVVPGSGFGCPGHFRISFCVTFDTIKKSIRAFDTVARQFGL